MGIILKHETTNKIIFYLKGADVVLVNKIKNGKEWCQEKCDELSRDGLRTLVYAQKDLSNSK